MSVKCEKEEKMDHIYTLLLPLGLILIFSKILVIGCKKFALPGVIGMLLSGVLLALIKFIPSQTVITDVETKGISYLSKIGVILIMFSAGLETDLKKIKKVGLPTVFITIAGVILPLALGFLVALFFNGGVSSFKANVHSNLFYGAILTATSVSVTVSTLKELGKLDGKAGTTIISAAILDDVVGVIVLSFVVSTSGKGNGSDKLWLIILLSVIYFVVVILLKLFIGKLFDWLDKRYPHHRRIPIFSLGFCFIFSYISEKVFGIADITGAFMAGLILSNNMDRKYIDEKTEMLGYMVFTPVFFANVGLTVKFSSIEPEFILFGVMFVLAGLLGKFFGCSATALACKYSPKDSVRVGLGMMARAEVALVCAQKGMDCGLISASITPFLFILIILTSFVVPLLLKLSYRGETQPLTPPTQEQINS